MKTDPVALLEELAGECAELNVRCEMVRPEHFAALSAAIALMRGQSEDAEWATDFELRALDVELSVGRTELEPGVHPRLPAHYRTRLQFGGPENPGNTVAFVFGNSSTERESRAMAEKMVAAYNAITPRPASRQTGAR